MFVLKQKATTNKCQSSVTSLTGKIDVITVSKQVHDIVSSVRLLSDEFVSAKVDVTELRRRTNEIESKSDAVAESLNWTNGKLDGVEGSLNKCIDELKSLVFQQVKIIL